jgi:hypothetical protein
MKRIVIAILIFAAIYTISINVSGILIPTDSPRQADAWEYDKFKIAGSNHISA